MGEGAGDPMRPAADVVDALRRHGATLACAESLTGGLLCAALVDVPGASDVLRGGVVAYARAVKASVLGVPAQILAEHGTVHERTAVEMARGAARVLAASHAVSTTGVAGPGASEGHRAGTVVMAVHAPGGVDHVRALQLDGDRDAVRHEAVDAALTLLLEVLSR